MYDDYPTIYETTINQSTIYYIILAVIILAIVVITFISLAKIFKKANRSGVSAFIPLYNIFVLLEIVNLPKWYFILLLIPIVNIFFYINVMMSLARLFRKSKLFAVGLIVAPFIYYPLLGFSDSEYVGINLVAMEGKSTVVEVPKVVDKEETKPTINESVDEGSRNINISIGGGVYQKNYTNTLLNVDEKQAIIDTQPKNANIEKKEESKPNIFVNKEPEIKQPQVNNSNNVQNINMPGLIDNSKVNNPVANQMNNNPTSTPEFITCPKCGATVKSDSKTCFLCGNRFD